MFLELSKLQDFVLKYSNHVLSTLKYDKCGLEAFAAEPPVKLPSEWRIWKINHLISIQIAKN